MPERINDHSLWRAFDGGELTHSAAHYLTAILRLRQRQGYARVTDVAEDLRISRGAASRAIAVLKDRGWTREDPHRMLELTDNGLELARGVERNYRVLECFLEDILGVPQAVAREDACKIEHLFSPPTIGALFRLIRALEGDKLLMKRLRQQLQADHTSVEQDFDPNREEESGKEFPKPCPTPRK